MPVLSIYSKYSAFYYRDTRSTMFIAEPGNENSIDAHQLMNGK